MGDAVAPPTNQTTRVAGRHRQQAPSPRRPARRRVGPGAPAINNWVTLACTVVGTVIAVLTFARGPGEQPPTPPPTGENAVLGVITGDISNRPNRAGESALGGVIADAQLWFTQDAGADLALVNSGGIRGSLLYGASPHGEAPGQVTADECLAVQPFRSRPLSTITLSGRQLRQVLEQQFAGYRHQTETRILQVSEGLRYRIDPTAPLGRRVSQLLLHNAPIERDAEYRVTINAFLATGGDGFAVLTQGRHPTTARGADYDALAGYLRRGEPIAPGRQDRIQLT
jgi:5'-nucleotidase